MPVSGLVIVLTGETESARSALAALQSDEDLTLGPVCGPRIPAVLETATAGAGRERLEWLRTLPGVATVEIAYVDFSDHVAAADAAGRADDGR